MISSMTGFARVEKESDLFQCTIELKSVNHRFKDIRVKLPNYLNSLEIPIRKKIETAFIRGSFDVFVTVKKKSSLEDKELDEEKVVSFVRKVKDVTKSESVSLVINPCDFLRQEFYKELEVSSLETLSPMLFLALDEAILDLKKSRSEEGEKLKGVILAHFAEYSKSYSELPALQESYKAAVEKKFRDKMSDFVINSKVDEPRFLQEVLYYLEKLDVEEELGRINIHFEKAKLLLSSNGEIGRELDFLLQELGRETNTLGSKSGLEEISSLVIKMKVQLEKIREQNLNLE